MATQSISPDDVLVVALYDRIIGFLNEASSATGRGDAMARREAVSQALDIVFDLRTRLHIDIEKQAAQIVSEFYAVIFVHILQASEAASQEKFGRVIKYLGKMREALCHEPSSRETIFEVTVQELHS